MLAREAERAKVDWASRPRPPARGFDGSTMGFRPVRRPPSGWPSLEPGARLPRARAYGGAEFADQALAPATTTARLACALSSSGWRPRSRGCSTGSYATRASPSTRAGASTWPSAASTRVIVLLRYLRQAHKQVTVSSLISGHRLYRGRGDLGAHLRPRR